MADGVAVEADATPAEEMSGECWLTVLLPRSCHEDFWIVACCCVYATVGTAGDCEACCDVGTNMDCCGGGIGCCECADDEA